MVRLRRAGLEAAVAAWWDVRAIDGHVTVQGRLRLSPPVGDDIAGWTLPGRVWLVTPLHSVPVVVQLWPVHSMYTKMTLTPQAAVLTTSRYFRLGHALLDRIESDLRAGQM